MKPNFVLNAFLNEHKYFVKPKRFEINKHELRVYSPNREGDVLQKKQSFLSGNKFIFISTS